MTDIAVLESIFDTPSWVLEIQKRCAGNSATDFLKSAIELAEASARSGCGPFGALIVSADGHIVAAGWNNVILNHDSTLHAEIHAIRRAEHHFKTHNLASVPGAPLTIYCSCPPCIQCFGAIYWSGIKEVVSAGSKSLAESAGFDEGPIDQSLWQKAHQNKQIKFKLIDDPVLKPEAPFKLYKKLGGRLY
ncbi:MAG: nucleoside deaminase [Candidatus Dadabacteria bacterium]|nr:MAG: nucleoside deaminase [Candidatus Dadabacteria bacterium]